ncbi:MAG: hypothetical protein JJLCMIEE_03332 [Acidimicrobiales bacterium]|nr:MAG: DUF1501 domain-containing protein [Actinomycetota bacterium]MBV6510202.1 hypothetical protein [Acidimicrobiales bacterium]RIK03528.1 MAG: hypothetical protein DCC48_16425 [Acidobacteriota bacterium]
MTGIGTISTTRRRFVAGIGAAGVLGATHAWLPRLAFGQDSGSGKTLVQLFLRGGQDGLSVVVPHQEDQYYSLRPSISVPPSAILPLTEQFGLHPAMPRFKELYDAGHLVLVPAAGSPDPSRSHFDAMDFMERGTPGSKTEPDGWLARHLKALGTDTNPLRAVGIGTMLPATLRGYDSAIAMQGLESFAITGRGFDPAVIEATLGAIYDSSDPDLVEYQAQQTLATLENIEGAGLGGSPAPERYGNSDAGRGLWEVAQLVNADVGLEAACVDFGGWDLHESLGTHQAGRMHDQVVDLDAAVGSFFDDIAARGDSVTLVMMSEFGRRVAENASAGADHGHGSVMAVLGVGLTGGVYGEWPGLEVLDRGDVQVVNDYRLVLAEVLQNRCASADPAAVFPGYSFEPGDYLGFTT